MKRIYTVLSLLLSLILIVSSITACTPTPSDSAALSTEAGIPMFILNGQDPEILYRLLDGEHIGTYFAAP